MHWWKKQQNWRTSDVLYVISHSMLMDYNKSKAKGGTHSEIQRIETETEYHKRKKKRGCESADSWETIIIIFCHLFSELQILLLSLSSLLWTHTDRVSVCPSAALGAVCVRLLPRQTPGPCCRPSVEISWPAQKQENSTYIAPYAWSKSAFPCFKPIRVDCETQ